MNCLICEKSLDDYTPLCTEHAPAWGQSIHIDKVTIILGELRFRDVIIIKLMGRKLIRWWLGTDVWLLHTFPKGRGTLSVLKHRLVYHLTKFFVSENWLTSERLKDEFVSCGGKRAIVRYHIRGMLTEKTKKLEHEGINIAYYWPNNGGEFQYDVYGIDFIKKVEIFFPEVNWVRLDGSFNMRVMYSILDGYIRPSKHDGRPRLIEECKINSIPYYWSMDGKPDVDELCYFVSGICEKRRVL